VAQPVKLTTASSIVTATTDETQQSTADLGILLHGEEFTGRRQSFAKAHTHSIEEDAARFAIGDGPVHTEVEEGSWCCEHSLDLSMTQDGLNHGIRNRGTSMVYGFHRSSTPFTIVRSLPSAWFATARMSSIRTGSRASGRHMSVAIEKPRTLSPACTATSTSGIVDIPITSAPISLRNRYSARVSRFGPVTAA